MIAGDLRDLPDVRRMDRDRRRRRSAAARLLRDHRSSRARSRPTLRHAVARPRSRRRSCSRSSARRSGRAPRPSGARHLLAAARSDTRRCATTPRSPRTRRSGRTATSARSRMTTAPRCRIVGSPITLSENPATARWHGARARSSTPRRCSSSSATPGTRSAGSEKPELADRTARTLRRSPPTCRRRAGVQSRRGCGPLARSAHDRRSSTPPCRRAGCAAWGTRRGRTRTDARSRRRTR